jgi:hypothetical protein
LFLISAILGIVLSFSLYFFTGVRKVDFDQNMNPDFPSPLIE